VALLASGTALVAGLVTGQEGAPDGRETGVTDEAEGELAERGRFLYEIYCMDCHGESGEGNGTVAREREFELPDLTRLAEGNEGTFPSLEVHEIIDGRIEVEGHRRWDMPVWGLAFQSRDQDAVQQDEVQGRIQQLIHYLRSIQIEAAIKTSGDTNDDR
jgi:mono/diheme cytochrome c family protein